MAITRAYNKHTGVYYAYDVQYVWNEEAHKKVQVRKCIGKFDPETNQVIPNGKRGPKPVKEVPDSPVVMADGSEVQPLYGKESHDISNASQQDLVSAVSDGFRQINETLQQIVDYIKIITPPPDE